MSRQKINWECTYKKMPKKVKEFLTQLLGKKKLGNLCTQFEQTNGL